MPERFHKLPDIKRVQKVIGGILLSTALCFTPCVANDSDNYLLPQKCYTNNLPDTSKCFHEILFSPYVYQILAHGYIDSFGIKQKHLPTDGEHNYNAGNYITGNLLYLDNTLSTNEIDNQSKELGIDPQQFAGSIATDSCFYKINHMVAFIRQENSKEPFSGKLLVIDCASNFDQEGRNEIFQSAGETSKNIFDQYQTVGGMIPAEIVLQTIDDPTIPDQNLDIKNAVNYPKVWCELVIKENCS